MAGIVQDEAFVSLATNNGYALGALVLGHSLRSVNTTRQLVIMITRDVHPQVRQELLNVWDRLVVVDVFDSRDATNLALLGRPDLGVTFTKLHAWKLTEYNKCVFLDSDVLVVQNIDDLFDRPEISAAPDIGWPDCFNSGVFVFVPSQVTYDALVSHALVHGSFDGGDQGLLNSYFHNWSQLGPAHRLPFTYNLHSNSSYTYSPAFNRFRDDVKAVHFLGPKKPWQYSVNLENGQVSLNNEDPQDTASGQYLQRWWNIYNQISHGVSDYQDQMSSQMSAPEDHHSGGLYWDVSNLSETLTENGTYSGSPNSSPNRVPQIIIDNPEGNRNLNERNHMHSTSTSTQSTSTSTSPESHEMTRLTSGVASIQFRNIEDDTTTTNESIVAPPTGDSSLAQSRWENGQIDYVGVDRFDNILNRLSESLQGSIPANVLS